MNSFIVIPGVVALAITILAGAASQTYVAAQVQSQGAARPQVQALVPTHQMGQALCVASGRCGRTSPSAAATASAARRIPNG